MNSPNEKFLGTTCKQCGTGSYIENENASEWWVLCDDCGHLMFCYTPMEHQLRFHQDSTKYKLYAGGRKSVASCFNKTRAKFGETLRAKAYDNTERSLPITQNAQSVI